MARFIIVKFCHVEHAIPRKVCVCLKTLLIRVDQQAEMWAMANAAVSVKYLDNKVCVIRDPFAYKHSVKSITVLQLGSSSKFYSHSYHVT
jgi:hypothetical protein